MDDMENSARQQQPADQHTEIIVTASVSPSATMPRTIKAMPSASSHPHRDSNDANGPPQASNQSRGDSARRSRHLTWIARTSTANTCEPSRNQRNYIPLLIWRSNAWPVAAHHPTGASSGCRDQGRGEARRRAYRERWRRCCSACFWRRPRVLSMHEGASLRRWPPTPSCWTARSPTTGPRPLRSGQL